MNDGSYTIAAFNMDFDICPFRSMLQTGSLVKTMNPRRKWRAWAVLFWSNLAVAHNACGHIQLKISTAGFVDVGNGLIHFVHAHGLLGWCQATRKGFQSLGRFGTDTQHAIGQLVRLDLLPGGYAHESEQFATQCDLAFGVHGQDGHGAILWG